MRNFLASIIMLTACPAAVASEKIVELSATDEVQMALRAAPEHLREKAGVYRLGQSGFELVRLSKNGFNCLVAREPLSGTGPLCFDREGSETTLKAELLRGKLLREGKTHAQIDELVNTAYKVKTLIAPRKPGIAYMLSSDFKQVNAKTGKTECIFPPHMMFYAPYMHNSDIGAEGNRGSTHMPWILNEGQPNAYILVVQHSADVDACQ